MSDRYAKITEFNYGDNKSLEIFYCELILTALKNKYKNLKNFIIPISPMDIENAIFNTQNNHLITFRGHQMEFVKLKEIFVCLPLVRLIINDPSNKNKVIKLGLPIKETYCDLALFVADKETFKLIDDNIEKALEETKAYFIQVKTFIDYKQEKSNLITPADLNEIQKFVERIRIKYRTNFDFFLYIFLKSFIKFDSKDFKSLFSAFNSLPGKILLGGVFSEFILYYDPESNQNKKIEPRPNRINFFISEILNDKIYTVDFPSPLTCL
jgi:hypothetical protein